MQSGRPSPLPPHLLPAWFHSCFTRTPHLDLSPPKSAFHEGAQLPLLSYRQISTLPSESCSCSHYSQSRSQSLAGALDDPVLPVTIYLLSCSLLPSFLAALTFLLIWSLASWTPTPGPLHMLGMFFPLPLWGFAQMHSLSPLIC